MRRQLDGKVNTKSRKRARPTNIQQKTADQVIETIHERGETNGRK